jgi:hypothetical protein
VPRPPRAPTARGYGPPEPGARQERDRGYARGRAVPAPAPSACHLLRAQRGEQPVCLLRRQDPRHSARHPPHQRRRSRDRLEPPCRRVGRPRGTGLTCTGVSPRATRYAYEPDTNDGRLAIVRADSPDSRSVSRTTVRSPRRAPRSDRHQGYLVRGRRCCEACQHRKRGPCPGQERADQVRWTPTLL